MLFSWWTDTLIDADKRKCRGEKVKKNKNRMDCICCSGLIGNLPFRASGLDL